MAVLCEALNVIVRVETLEEEYPGGLDGYKENVPNKTFCTDGKLTRIGFMTPQDVGKWIEHLEKNGLIFSDNGETIDICVVDEINGPTLECNRLKGGRKDGIGMVRIEGETDIQLHIPEGFDPDKKMTFVKSENIKNTEITGVEDGLESYTINGENMYVGRTSEDTLSEEKDKVVRILKSHFKCKDIVSYDTSSNSKKMKPIYVGETKEEKKIYLDLEKENLHFIFLGGATGTGKTIFHLNLYKQLIENNASDEIGFIFMDYTQLDFMDWKGKYILYRPEFNEVNIEERYQILEALGNDPSKYGDKKVFVHIEENELAIRDNKRFRKAIKAILKNNKNIYIIYSTSRLTKHSLLDEIDLKVIFGTYSAIDSILFLGNDIAARLQYGKILAFKNKQILCELFTAKEMLEAELFCWKMGGDKDLYEETRLLLEEVEKSVDDAPYLLRLHKTNPKLAEEVSKQFLYKNFAQFRTALMQKRKKYDIIYDEDNQRMLDRVNMFIDDKIGSKSPIQERVLGGDGTKEDPFIIKDDEELDFIMEERSIIKSIYGDFCIRYHGPIDEEGKNGEIIDSMDITYIDDDPLKETKVHFYIVYKYANKHGVYRLRHNDPKHGRSS